MIVDRERGKGAAGREEEGRECTDLERRGLVYKSQTPLAASGRERGKGKAGRE